MEKNRFAWRIIGLHGEEQVCMEKNMSAGRRTGLHGEQVYIKETGIYGHV